MKTISLKRKLQVVSQMLFVLHRSGALLILLLGGLLFLRGGSAFTNETRLGWKPPFKMVEVKHFTQMAGQGFSQSFIDYFYAGLRENVIKAKLGEQLVDEGTKLSEADAANSVVIEGKFTSNQSANMMIDGRFGMEIQLFRKSDHALITTITPLGVLHHRGFVSEERIEQLDGTEGGRFAAYEIVKPFKKHLVLLPPAAPVSPPPEPQTNTNTAANAPAVAGDNGASPRGALLVSSEPAFGEVSVDGAFVGTTPANLKLTRGVHVIEVKLDGYKTYHKELSVMPDSELTLHAQLEK